VLFPAADPVAGRHPVRLGQAGAGQLRRIAQSKKDMLWVALAGPASNLAMALGWALLYKMAWLFPDSYFAEPLWHGRMGD